MSDRRMSSNLTRRPNNHAGSQSEYEKSIVLNLSWLVHNTEKGKEAIVTIYDQNPNEIQLDVEDVNSENESMDDTICSEQRPNQDSTIDYSELSGRLEKNFQYLQQEARKKSSVRDSDGMVILSPRKFPGKSESPGPTKSSKTHSKLKPRSPSASLKRKGNEPRSQKIGKQKQTQNHTSQCVSIKTGKVEYNHDNRADGPQNEKTSRGRRSPSSIRSNDRKQKNKEIPTDCLKISRYPKVKCDEYLTQCKWEDACTYTCTCSRRSKCKTPPSHRTHTDSPRKKKGLREPCAKLSKSNTIAGKSLAGTCVCKEIVDDYCQGKNDKKPISIHETVTHSKKDRGRHSSSDQSKTSLEDTTDYELYRSKPTKSTPFPEETYNLYNLHARLSKYLVPGENDPRQKSRQKLCEYVFRDVVGANNTFIGPWGKNPVTYLDYVASGRPLKCIENYIRENVMPTYANTHTEVSFNAQQTTLFREEARAIIKESVNANADDCVIFTGSGSTSAVNKLIHALKPEKPLVLVGPYEHHSNILPWLGVPGAKVVRIRQARDGLLDLENLKSELKKSNKRQIIGSFSAASNVTGILTDVDACSHLVHKYGGVVLFDYACAAPYVDIDMNPVGFGEQKGLVFKDAIFISTHKFIGGPGTPGILVAKRHLFHHETPHNVGGGTVAFVRRKTHRYLADIEAREEGGTPAILESIRAGLVFKLKETFTPAFIMTKEEEMYQKAKALWSKVPNLIILGNLDAPRLPIFPMLFYNQETGRLLHHDFVALIMNDVLGMQVRSGCACAAPYGLDLMGMSEERAEQFERLVVQARDNSQKTEDEHHIAGFDNVIFKPGFTRLNLPFFLSENTFDFVLKAVQLVAENAWSLLPQYDFDKKTGKWWFKQQTKIKPKKHLKNVSFDSGQLEVDEEEGKTNSSPYPEEPEDIDTSSFKGVLKRARTIFDDAKSDTYVNSTDHIDLRDHEMRWFMLPEEAADILNGKQVKHLAPEELPFFPGALARKLEVTVTNHKSRVALDEDFPLEYH